MWTHNLDPVIFDLGPLQVRWYGLMYVIGFIIAGQLFNRLSKQGFLQFTKKDIDNFITTMMIGMFLGARLVYVFVYNWDYYSQNLSELLAVWKGGLSFHGAIIGFVITMIIWAKKKNLSFFQISDSLALAGTPGMCLGRIGNFINGELYGRTADVPWAMIFPGGGPYPRHPSQLYEAFFEGLILFCVLWAVKQKVNRYGIISTLFLVGYGVARYFIEFFREADSQLGYYFGGTTTMGQILCLLMIGAGLFVFYMSSKKNVKIEYVG